MHCQVLLLLLKGCYEHLKGEFWMINHRQSLFACIKKKWTKPFLYSLGNLDARARFKTSKNYCWAIQVTDLSKVSIWLTFLLFSSEILIPFSTTHADYWNIIVFNPATILHARVFVCSGVFGRIGERVAVAFLVRLTLPKSIQLQGVNRYFIITQFLQLWYSKQGRITECCALDATQDLSSQQQLSDSAELNQEKSPKG